jgi:hypothetical protein
MIHLRDILLSRVGFNKDYSSVKSQLIKDLKKKGCTYHPLEEGEGGLVKGWDEDSLPPYAPYNHSDIINRLDGQVFELEGKSFTTSNHIALSGRFYTTLHTDDGEVSYQTLNPEKRGKFTWNEKPLQRFDVSASQLKVALALRGEVLPFDRSPWDELKVEHPALDTLSSKDRRKIIKKFGLFRVWEEDGFDVIKAWEEELGEQETRPALPGLKGAVWSAMEEAFPALKEPLSPLPYRTPDGYLILAKEGELQVPIKSDTLGINTTFRLPAYVHASASHVLEAMEGFVLREAIRALPVDAPVLTCHDEVVTLPEYINRVQEAWVQSLAMLQSRCLRFNKSYEA